MICVALALLLADPQIITGRVVSIHDGDTITVLDTDKHQHKIRLTSIDAPELKQAFGSRSKEALSKLIAEKDVSVRWSKRDRYGRIVGDVYLGDRWINREMVELGFAWHYRQFSKSKDLQAAEDAAREKRVGLWGDKDPVPPWEWRKNITHAHRMPYVESGKYPQVFRDRSASDLRCILSTVFLGGQCQCDYYLTLSAFSPA